MKASGSPDFPQSVVIYIYPNFSLIFMQDSGQATPTAKSKRQ
jgi:hypothetical protein